MFDCKCECAYISIIAGIIFGVVAAVLYALGFIGIGVLLAVVFFIGIAGIFLLPVYSLLSSSSSTCYCFCSYRRLMTVASIGTLITAFATYVIFRAFESIILTAILVAVSAFFAVLLIGAVICLTKSVCCRE